MTPGRKLLLTAAVVALSTVLLSLANVVPIAMDPWQYNLTASVIVAVFTAAIWTTHHARHRATSRRVPSPRPRTTTVPAGKTA